ncbi:MAG: helix-turn-helix transcriptional regulator [Actinomycetaceae bacterium]|nr:helix-turn-helix transcriptional regulator [Actinomycetaceae bacterium]
MRLTTLSKPDAHAIVVTLDQALEARGWTLTQLSEATGITLANLSILKTGKARAIRFTTLHAICQALGCQPGDILTYTTTHRGQ